MITQDNIKVTAYKSDGFIGKYQKLIRDTVIPYQYSVLCDEAPDTEKSHVVKNFENAEQILHGKDLCVKLFHRDQINPVQSSALLFPCFFSRSPFPFPVDPEQTHNDDANHAAEHCSADKQQYTCHCSIPSFHCINGGVLGAQSP